MTPQHINKLRELLAAGVSVGLHTDDPYPMWLPLTRVDDFPGQTATISGCEFDLRDRKLSDFCTLLPVVMPEDMVCPCGGDKEPWDVACLQCRCAQQEAEDEAAGDDEAAIYTQAFNLGAGDADRVRTADPMAQTLEHERRHGGGTPIWGALLVLLSCLLCGCWDGSEYKKAIEERRQSEVIASETQIPGGYDSAILTVIHDRCRFHVFYGGGHRGNMLHAPDCDHGKEIAP